MRWFAGSTLGGQERVQLVDPLLELQNLVGAGRQQIGVEPVAPHHLDGEPADVAELDLASSSERSPLAPQRDRVGRRGRRALDDFDHLHELVAGRRRRGDRTASPAKE